ncbi:hypothetical protein QYS49_19160 [Marivirga salinae]|uniref:Uncharacterized protein n=1 Tax=Marivirga salinarum TaxID=3059078 RepID=A0AA49JB76_9BACT|nr:hypothetical protein [Marivirga sp. BDSF4-3]WKK73949.1 hypothetical protein QYS49_19160 [Marivirga sp. BDSF4-3]
MDFTKHEQTVIQELEKRAGDVLYLQDIAPYFISKSCLQISTYTQTAYIQVGDNMQNALSEYFQLVVFIKKLEQNGACFSIPYTPLKDNLVQIGNSDFEEYQKHTLADGDLLIQLFQYAGKKYVIAPNASEKFQSSANPVPIAKQNKVNLIIPSFILFLLFVFIGIIGYQSYEDHNNLKIKQEAIGANLEQQSQNIELLTNQIQNQEKQQDKIQAELIKDIDLINNSLEEQKKSLRSVRYWNRKQFDQLEELILITSRDSMD